MVDCVLEGFECLAGFRLSGGSLSASSSGLRSRFYSCVEHRDVDAVAGDRRCWSLAGGGGARAGAGAEESVQAQAPEVVAHLAGAVVLAEVSGNEPSEDFCW